jgi:hypothetical protein
VSLGHTALFVALADLDGHTLTRFYQALLEQDPVVDIPDVYAEFVLSGMRIGLFKPSNTHRTEFASLSSLGYPPPGEIQHTSHGREIYGYDPQGNRLILHEATAPVLG